MTNGEMTRKRILDAALGEFSANGFEGARVAKIASVAGVNKERLYAYFGSKESLFVEVWKITYQSVIEVDKDFFALVTDENYERMGSIILARYMEFHERHPEFWKILAWENLQGGRHVDVVKDLKRPVHAYLRKFYEKGRENGCFKREVSFETFMLVIISVSFTYASNRATMSQTLGMDLSDPEVKQRYIREVEHWFLP
jgi:AcrR family transcriptional regulator